MKPRYTHGPVDYQSEVLCDSTLYTSSGKYMSLFLLIDQATLSSMEVFEQTGIAVFNDTWAAETLLLIRIPVSTCRWNHGCNSQYYVGCGGPTARTV